MNDFMPIEVLIVGAGPVGLALAIDLASRGIALRIIDKLTFPAIGSRARGISPRTQEIFEDLGVLKSVAACAAPILPLRFFDAGGRLVREIDPRANPAVVPTSDMPYRAPLMVRQTDTEVILRQRLAVFGYEVEMGCLLTNFLQDADCVTATIQKGDAVETIVTRFLVGCDGGHSVVRKNGNFSFLGETWDDTHQIFANVQVQGLEPTYWHSWALPGGGSVMLQPMHDGEWFFAAPAAADEQGELPSTSLETLQKLVDMAVKSPKVTVSNPTWITIWRPNIRMVDRYRNGRVLLAGDAAHVHSAAGGQGMNTGIQDAYNLGWKLAHVLRGAPESLLDTYESERLPVAKGVLDSTTNRHKAMKQTDAGGKTTGVQALTNLVTGKDPFGDITQLSIAYRESSLSANVDGATGIRAGDRAPDAACIRVCDGKPMRLFDVFQGTHFSLLSFSDEFAPCLPHQYHTDVQTYAIRSSGDKGESSDHILIDCDENARRAYGVTNDALILVRPDGYVGLTAGSINPQPVLDYLQRVLGR
ncbi:MAG: 3-(3-hydroxyphenyl)propionate hydroxylase [Anaerolineaceae bacterium]|nr:3-(3-hydroxyphenyl)propionate hydroxylase [Anaerolineaceae bacterium]